MTALTNWAQFLRLRLLPTAVSNLLLGVVAGSLLLPSAEVLTISLCWVILLYLFGMGLNDLIDIPRDRRISPQRPLPSGRISATHARWFLGAIFFALFLVGSWLPAPAKGVALAALTCVLLYNFALKEIPILGPLAMGGVRCCVVLLGGSIAGAPIGGVLLPGIAVGSYTALLTHFSQKEEAGSGADLVLRHLALTAFVIASGLILPGLDHPLAIPLMIVLASWLLIFCDPQRQGSPPRSTLAMLVLLPLLDLRWMLAYDPGPVLWLVPLLWLSLRPWALPPSGTHPQPAASGNSDVKNSHR